MYSILRLFDFDNKQALQFQDIIKSTLLVHKGEVDLRIFDFIESLNCELALILGNKDIGIQRTDINKFICQLTERKYLNMIDLIQPFTEDDVSRYQWLYDLDYDVTSTEFLFSPGGTW
ncbi:MAG: hypothetical protein NVV82_26735 [Sporocytophaga sp.]|nr:hypothetical protein [Sporocytophaga sp.]